MPCRCACAARSSGRSTCSHAGQDFGGETLRLGQALADVASIGLLQVWTIRQRDALSE
jgi:hypothetical protein